MTREVLLVLHSGRETNLRTAAEVATRLAAADIRLRVLGDEWAEVDDGNLPEPLTPRVVEGRPGCAEGAEVDDGDQATVPREEVAREQVAVEPRRGPGPLRGGDGVGPDREHRLLVHAEVVVEAGEGLAEAGVEARERGAPLGAGLGAGARRVNPPQCPDEAGQRLRRGKGVERVGRRNTRPLLRNRDAGQVLAELARVRNPIYAKAHIHIASNKAPHEATVASILKAIGL